MTFNDVISLNSVASGAHCVKMVEDVVVTKFAFAISSADEFLVLLCSLRCLRCMQAQYSNYIVQVIVLIG